MGFLGKILVWMAVVTWVPAMATTFEETLVGLGKKDLDAVSQAVSAFGELDDQRILALLQALNDAKLVVNDNNHKIYIQLEDATLVDVITGEKQTAQNKTLRTVETSNVIRRSIDEVLLKFRLFSPDMGVRKEAALSLTGQADVEKAAVIDRALVQEKDQEIRHLLEMAQARAYLASTETEKKLQGIKSLAQQQDKSTLKPLLVEILMQNEDGSYVESSVEVRKAAQHILDGIQQKELLLFSLENLSQGLSLGSILLLAAIGLAITFGLMGVINMAHGEMLMIGAYATYVVQTLFKTYLSTAMDWYLVAAMPVAFLVAATVGLIMERLVVRHLYGRPLDSLLATWGVSLILIQLVRLSFGAQNVAVENPDWLKGNFQLMGDFAMTYNRAAIILFVVFVVALVWYLINKTPLGLQVRAVQQNRNMAAAMGINTSRVDMWTFAVGSGVAGLGGVALSQVGNVGPELGQTYIIDSFMVVVLGGVGKLVGAIVGALGLGIFTKIFEASVDAVLGKILVLVFVILFIQRRPQGIFALKGRATEN